MIFILLLTVTTTSIAGVAAFFSVYGLAQLFKGIFWMVVVMGASLEAGKLIAASYLYRYWDKTHIALKAYLMAGIFSLMVLTSTGIFGILAAGYQSDSVPLKQIDTQIVVLEEERARKIERKKEIDNQISSLPTDMVQGRVRLIKQFKDEQLQVTTRVTELDQQITELKQQQITISAHIGPITYIATAFGSSPDQATKWLILLIIFAFDPLAVALTLAVNIAIKQRSIEKEEKAKADATAPRQRAIEDVARPFTAVEHSIEREHIVEHDVPIAAATPVPPVEPMYTPLVVEEPAAELVVEAPVVEELVVEQPVVEEPAAELVVEAPVVEELVVEQPVVEEPPAAGSTPRTAPAFRHRPYAHLWNQVSIGEKIGELVNVYQHLREKQNISQQLTKDELWEMSAIEQTLRNNGYGEYIK